MGLADLAQILKENEAISYDLHLQTYNEMAITTKKGTPMEGTRHVSVIDGVAVMNLFGPIYPRANMMTMSGATSIQQFVSDFVKAYNSDDIKAILMNGDTPGGDVRGVPDSSALIYQASKQDRKPIHSFVEGYGASAGYYILSACQQGNFYGSKSSLTGSIGVILTVQAKSNGIYEIVSSISPNKRPDPSTDEGMANLREQVNDLGDQFRADVMRNRGITLEKFTKDYGQGSVKVGPRAKSLGLIDGISTLSEAIDRAAKQGYDKSMSRKNRTYSKALLETPLSALLESSVDNEEQIDMALKDLTAKFKTTNDALDFEEEAQEDAVATTEEGGDATASEEGETLTAEQKAQALKAKREELEETYSDKAELFATNMVMDSRIFPNEMAHCAGDYLTALIDDKLHGGTTSFVTADGEVTTGTRAEACQARYASRSQHTMTKKIIAGVKKGDIAAHVLQDTPKEDVDAMTGDMSAERRAQLLGSSEMGQKALANIK